ncbi:hypothetical protein BC749_103147 [Flavobacterium araucananum]|uniref:Uncharacterized protein n=1 Tax=Flavobacterium araucananum TaxID=946678 RepID=A0A227PI24_9FLAO|nr:hypothetical protein [Flavobacterium araucananum]OXG09044.1 hypothetical protein B0A64_03350 [Flavobacterium araucananum]PWJ99768.1 hypothetical protein BC749_103147 [Flavobacterium araucananum]
MSKVAKFVVIINDNVVWMEEKALKFYSDLFGSEKEIGEKYAQENLSSQKLFKIQNDFSVEMLMAYEGENPLSFMKLNSSRLVNQNLGANKPISVNHIVYFDPEDLVVLFKRAEEVAMQRKHDLIWVKVFEIDSILIQTLNSLGYQKFDYENESEQEIQKQLYFKKSV